MDGLAAETIKDLALKTAEPVVVNDVAYAPVHMHRVRKEERADTLELKSLDSFIDYINHVSDKNIAAGSFVQVVNQKTVLYASPLDDLKGRDYYARATCDTAKFPYGQNLDLDEFIIQLQTCFYHTKARAAVLAMVGNIVDSAEIRTEDDGVTQAVATRKGLSMQEMAEVPNPVMLAPYRTFAEISQPESPFILRVNSCHNRVGTGAALYYCEDPVWRHKVMADIKAYLSGVLTTTQVI